MSGGQKVASRPALPPPPQLINRGQLMSRTMTNPNDGSEQSRSSSRTLDRDQVQRRQPKSNTEQRARLMRRTNEMQQQQQSSLSNARGCSVPRASKGPESKSKTNLGTSSQPTECWNSLDDLFWEHMREVQNKWQTLKMNDDIWAKLIYFEQNRRLAKAYVSTPVLTIDGSTSGLDGLRIGLSGIENSYRSLDSIASLRSIGQGIKLKIDGEGNILVRRMGGNQSVNNSSTNCSIWVKDWPPTSSDSSLGGNGGTCSSPHSSSSLSDSYTSAGSSTTSSSSSSSFSSSGGNHYVENWRIKKLSCEYNDDNSMETYKLFDMKRFRAQIERQRRQAQYSNGSDGGDQKQLVDWRQCVSIVCFVHSDINSQHISGNQLTKQLIAEDKLNRNPQRILREPCWIMLINIIAIDMLKSLLCDNKSNIRPALPMLNKRNVNSNSNNNISNISNSRRYEMSSMNKQGNGINLIGQSSSKNKLAQSMAQQNYERANSRILEHDEDGDENNYDDNKRDYFYHRGQSLLQRDPNAIDNHSDNYKSKVLNSNSNGSTKLTSSGNSGLGKLKPSLSIASLHPSGGEKSRSSSSGNQLANYLLFPTNNIINYFSNNRRESMNNKTSLIGDNDNFTLSKQQTAGLSKTTNLGMIKFNKQLHVDQIYSKSDHIRFDAVTDPKTQRFMNHRSQQHLDRNLSDDYLDYKYENNYRQLEDDDAIYTTFTGKYLYNDKNKLRRAKFDDSIYSTPTQAPFNPDYSLMTSNQRQSSSSLYPVDSLMQHDCKIKLAQMGLQQSRSSFDLSHGHKLDLRHLKTPASIKINFDDSDEDNRRRTSADTTLKSRRAMTAFNKKASEWSRLAKRFATNRRSSFVTSPQVQQSTELSDETEAKYQKRSEKQEHDSSNDRNQSQKISRSSIVSSSSSSGCPENDYFLSQSSMSSSSSSEPTNDGDMSATSTSQPASSSGIAGSANSSGDYRTIEGEECPSSNKQQKQAVTDGMEPGLIREKDKQRVSRNKKVNSPSKARLRSVSRGRYDNFKLLDEANPNCDHNPADHQALEDEQEQPECDCSDCGYHLELHNDKISQEIGAYSDCSCCCDCFYEESTQFDIEPPPPVETTVFYEPSVGDHKKKAEIGIVPEDINN